MVFSKVAMNDEMKMRIAFFASLAVLTFVMAAMAHAGGTDTTFDVWVDEMTAWITGSLGKGIAIAFVMVGIVMGVVRQSLMAFAIGVGAALGLNYTPTIIGNLFTAIL